MTAVRLHVREMRPSAMSMYSRNTLTYTLAVGELKKDSLVLMKLAPMCVLAPGYLHLSVWQSLA